MAGFTLAATASVAAGVVLGIAATVGVTLAAESYADRGAATPAQSSPRPAGPALVEYGDRCIHGHCLHW